RARKRMTRPASLRMARVLKGGRTPDADGRRGAGSALALWAGAVGLSVDMMMRTPDTGNEAGWAKPTGPFHPIRAGRRAGTANWPGGRGPPTSSDGLRRPKTLRFDGCSTRVSSVTVDAPRMDSVMAQGGHEMTLYWIYDLPNWVLGVFIVSTLLAFSLAGLFATRPVVRMLLGPTANCNDVVGSFFAGIGVFYGLALGLIAVATWENYTDIDGVVGTEAAAVASFYRDLDGYSQPLRRRLEDMMRDYTTVVI